VSTGRILSNKAHIAAATRHMLPHKVQIEVQTDRIPAAEEHVEANEEQVEANNVAIDVSMVRM
jgi:hypothetical protein